MVIVREQNRDINGPVLRKTDKSPQTNLQTSEFSVITVISVV